MVGGFAIERSLRQRCREVRPDSAAEVRSSWLATSAGSMTPFVPM